jgi:hypothetical protein
LNLDALIERKEKVYPSVICEATLAPPFLLHLGNDLAAAPLDTASLRQKTSKRRQKAIKWRGKGQNYGLMERAPLYFSGGGWHFSRRRHQDRQYFDEGERFGES